MLDELILRVLAGTASPSEEERVRDWCAQDPDNDTYFRAMRGVWSLTAPAPRRAYPPPEDLTVIFERGSTVADAQRAASHPRRRPAAWRRLEWGLAMAATVAAVALGIRMVGSVGGVATETFVAEAGEARTVVLDDGTSVRLAPGSRLEQSFADGERRSSLEGRAFFAVTHDPERPFVVRAAGSEIRVLGTRFELAETEAGTRTVVLEGRVRVSNAHGDVEVPAGSIAEATDGAAPTATAVDDVYALLDWPYGILLFQSTPLRQVADEVARHFGRTVTVEDEALGDVRISASFEREDFAEVVQVLCDVSGAACELTEAGAVIAPR